AYPSFVYDRKEGVSPATPGMLSDGKTAIETQVAQESPIVSDMKRDDAVEPSTLSDTKEDTALAPAIMSDIKEEMDAPAVHTSHPVAKRGRRKVSDTKAGTVEENAPFASDRNVPAFDTSKYTLGRLCPRGHDYHGTGKTLLRLANQGCLACD